MNVVKINVILILLTVQCAQPLRCRSGSQRLNDEYKKIMQTCRRRYSGSRGEDDNSSTRDSNDSEGDSSSSEGSVFGHDFFSGSRKINDENKNEYNKTHYKDGQSYLNYRSRRKRNSNIRNYHENSMDNSTDNRNSRNRNSNGGSHPENSSKNLEDTDEQFCRSHCFFDELNVVDHQGYPERVAVTRVMTRGVQDPALRDFIEESILECFHFILSTMTWDKCVFSRHLMNCLTDKGREGCEDWSD